MSDEEEILETDLSSDPSKAGTPSPARGEGNTELSREELLDKWKRTAADFENYKKRKEAEGPEMVQFAKELVVTKLMPSLQNLEQVLKYAPTDDKYKDWLAGLSGTIAQLEHDMEDLGLKKIITAGQTFDPNRHEAVEEQEGEPGKILSEIQPGFTLNDKVIIPAKVIVGKNN
ncbi:MAG TPA: nucleotide exchange factor GrpE [Patescibacteria group bacterium]|nr:nucleotide exchange factor GrpE [Patescibacteria group bacterium]